MLKFIGIGAQKAGTTWLHEQLCRHPEVYFERGIKEFHHWDRQERGEAVPTLAHYQARFGTESQCSGDITPAYATLQPETIAQLASAFPRLKILFILRDPVDRAWSAARMFLRQAWIHPEEMDENWLYQLCTSASFTARGNYELTLQRWMPYFPASAFFLMDYQELSRNPRALLLGLAAHLELSQLEEWVNDPCVSESSFASPAWPIPSGLRDRLSEYYGQHNTGLSARLETFGENARVNCSAWA